MREKRGQTLALQEKERLTVECLANLEGIVNGGISAESILEAHRLVALNSDATANALQQLLERDSGTSARKLLTRLLQPNMMEAFLPILHELTLALATTKLPVGEASYYGNAPMQWKHLFFPEGESVTIVETLLKFPHSKALFDSIGNIVQYAPDEAIRCIVPKHWGTLAGAIHQGASYAAAAILRADMTHFGMDLIQAMDRPFEEAFLQTNEGMWILQGLSRREQECVELLLNTQSVCNSLRSVISTSSDVKILLPALQALTNLGIPCDGVLSHIHTIPDAIPAAVACTAKEKWIALFADMLVQGSVSYAWKVEVVYALADFRALLVEQYWCNELVEPLVGLSRLHETAEPAVAILDRALRCSNGEIGVVFEAAGGIEVLEERAADGLRMAEELVDDFFADDGANEDSISGFLPPPVLSTGRGRGKPVPAWMANQR